MPMLMIPIRVRFMVLSLAYDVLKTITPRHNEYFRKLAARSHKRRAYYMSAAPTPPRGGDQRCADRIGADQNEIVTRVVVADCGVQREHRDGRRRIEQEQRLSRREGAHAGYDEGRKQNQANHPTGPHAAPSQRNAYQQIAPPSGAHFVERDGADQRIEPRMLPHQRVAPLP